MNFSTELVEHINVMLGHKKIREGLDPGSYQLVKTLLYSGEKYLLPENGEVGLKLKGLDPELFKFARPPYPITIFEYSDSHPLEESIVERNNMYGAGVVDVGKSSKRITIVIDCESEEFSGLFKNYPSLAKSNSILIIGANYLDDEASWQITPLAGILDLNNPDLRKTSSPSGKTYDTFGYHVFELFPKTIELAISKFGDQIVNDLHRDLGDDLRIAVTALIAINCRNIEEISTEPSEKLNKKRAKNGKAPFFKYRVLDIFLNEVRKIPRSGGRRQAAIRAWLSAPSRKLGSVRGHFKKRKSGVWFWRSHLRGNPEKGTVIKNYNVIENK